MAVKVKNTKSDPPRPCTIILYGRHKVGKTRFVGTMPKPVFIVPRQETGTMSLNAIVEVVDGFDYIEAGTIQEYLDACLFVKDNADKRGWRTCAVDPLTSFGRLFQLEIEQKYPNRKDNFSIWGEVMQTVLNGWKILQGVVHLVWVCHTDEGKSGDFVLEEKPALVGKSIEILEANADIVLFMTARVIEHHDAEGKVTASKKVRQVWVRCPPTVNPPFRVGGRYEEAFGETNSFLPDWSIFANRLKGYIRT